MEKLLWMRRYALVCKKAFTLIEVMIAVMIVSIVIAALLKLRGDTNKLFMNLEKQARYSSLSTLLLYNRDYGLDTTTTTLYDLVNMFDINDDLRRKLKHTKITVSYEKLNMTNKENISFEIGQSHIQGKKIDIYLNRIIKP